MKNTPQKIFLQVDSDGETPENFNELAVTWATERVHPNDIEYSLTPTPSPIKEGGGNILGNDNPWPLTDVLNKLIESAEILLDKKNYDGHGWEEIFHAKKRAKEIVAALSLPSAAVNNIAAIYRKHKLFLDVMKENLSRAEEEKWSDAEVSDTESVIKILASVLSDLNKVITQPSAAFQEMVKAIEWYNQKSPA